MRHLSDSEKRLAEAVFEDSLPSWRKIYITDGLGPIPTYDQPYTTEDMALFFVNVGPDYYPDLDRTNNYGYSSARRLLIHELTHVWQYHHGYWVILRSLWAQRKGYYSTIEESDAWDDFNVEQQAQKVEEWYAGGMSETDLRFVFVDKIIRPGVTGGFWATPVDVAMIKLPLAKLRDL
jgi:hypothetical protein